MYKIKLLALMLLFLMVACGTSQVAIQTAVAATQSKWTAVPTQTAYPTYTPQPTIVITKIVMQIVTQVVTQTFTPTLKYTPTITPTPTKTLRPSPTPDPLKLPKEDGNYLVGVDIAPGVWRNDGSTTINDNCYWETLTKTGDIIANYLGAGGGTAYIGSTSFAFHSEDCGTWTFLSSP